MPEDALVQRLDLFRFDASHLRKTPEGGIIVKARIARTGVLEYTNADGSTRRELRLPEDVFSPAALASFDQATVTELHPGGLVTPLNWRKVAIGHLGGTPVADGEFANVDIHVKHADGVRGVESGKLKEVSCGYECRIDATPGVHPKYGRYDARQYDNTGNHVALGPAGWGRSGSDVSLRADGFDGGVCVSELEGAPYVHDTMAEKKKIPATETETETDVVEPIVDKADAAETRRVAGENAALKAENARLTAAAKTRTDAEQSAEALERNDAAIEERVSLIDAAKPHLDEKGKPWSHKGKTDDAIRREVIAKLEPGLELPDVKEDGAADFVLGAYGVAVKRAVRGTKSMLDARRASPNGGRADSKAPPKTEKEDAGAAGTGDVIADAADADVKKQKARWQKPRADRGRGARS